MPFEQEQSPIPQKGVELFVYIAWAANFDVIFSLKDVFYLILTFLVRMLLAKFAFMLQNMFILGAVIKNKQNQNIKRSYYKNTRLSLY